MLASCGLGENWEIELASCSANKRFMKMAKQSMLAVAFFLGAFATIPPKGAQPIGVCYGRIADNLPPASDVVQLYTSNGIEAMRIYNADTDTLQALNGSNIGLIMDVGNADLASLASDPSAAAEWVQKNVVAFPGVSFRYIAVGNKAVESDAFAADVLPALRNIDDALSQAGLGKIKASTAVSSVVLTASLPPSAGKFSSSYMMTLIARYLANTGAPLLTNLYPYFFHAKSETRMDIDYALLNSSGPLVQDGDYSYTNLFDALVDAFYSALEHAGAGNVTVVVSESGWPSAGRAAATTSNARTYIQNLISHVRKGTPKRPGAMEAYIFAMFNENMKDGDMEQHFGLFNPDKSPVYPGLFSPVDKSSAYSDQKQVTQQSHKKTQRLIIVLTTSIAVGVVAAILASIWFHRKPPPGTGQVLGDYKGKYIGAVS